MYPDFAFGIMGSWGGSYSIVLQDGKMENQGNIKQKNRGLCFFTKPPQRVDKPIDTLSDEEKGRYIFRTSIRRRT